MIGKRVRTIRLLLVDDEPDVRTYYRSVLEEAGCAVTTAGTAKEGARAALEEPFDVALVDERLPDRRGLALIRWLRRRFPSMKLVLFSAFADWDMYFRGTGLGAFDVLAKDRPTSELLRVLGFCAS
jgi:DNA-binding response OmpR family regulator